jgi:hypothetical protein
MEFKQIVVLQLLKQNRPAGVETLPVFFLSITRITYGDSVVTRYPYQLSPIQVAQRFQVQVTEREPTLPIAQ